MLGALGAPSLPKFKPPHRSAPADEGAAPPATRQSRPALDLRRNPRAPESAPPSAARREPSTRTSRPTDGPIAVAGRSSRPSPVVGRPAAAVPRIVEAAVRLRPETCTRLRLVVEGLQIELFLRGGVVQGVVQTASESEKQLVAAHLDHLRTSLEGKGVEVGELRVTVAGAPSDEVAEVPSLRRYRVNLLA